MRALSFAKPKNASAVLSPLILGHPGAIAGLFGHGVPNSESSRIWQGGQMPGIHSSNLGLACYLP
jgi:hypothetical protein